MNSGVVIECIQFCKKCITFNVRGKYDIFHRNANRRTALHCAALIRKIILSFTHADDGEARFHAVLLQRGDIRFHTLVQRRCDRSALQYFRHQHNLP